MMISLLNSFARCSILAVAVALTPVLNPVASLATDESLEQEASQQRSEAASIPKVTIHIDLKKPANSHGLLRRKNQPMLRFKLAYGRNGVQCEGARFRDGYSLLGAFSVNALLSENKFEMTPELINFSPRREPYLKAELFKNMNSIDFENDGKVREYGDGYISLLPLSETKQPFNFGEFKGLYRWYSYAIHGTNDPRRIGKATTGGCINVGSHALREMFKHLKLGDRVDIYANGSLSPDGCSN